MSEDARFEDAAAAEPLRLVAFDEDDLRVIAALAQDAVFAGADMAWRPRERRFALLVNRFRWEDKEAAEREGRPYERVRSLLVFNDVLAVRSEGVDPAERDLIYELLDIAFEPGEPPGGRVRLILAGDGEIALEVECIDAILKDVSRPWPAPSGKAPRHPLDETPPAS